MAIENSGDNREYDQSLSSDYGVYRLKYLLLLFISILAIRAVAIVIVNLVGFNPFGTGQAGSHARTAEAIASSRFMFDFDMTRITHRWGLLLAPFWLLPGPSELYAQIAVAVIGSIAILNVYLICEYFHSRQAGVIAILPLALLPTYTFMHAVLQREALILFGVTTAFVLVFLPNRHVNEPWNYPLAVGFVFLAGYQRVFNIPVILLVVGFMVFIAFLQSHRLTIKAKLSGLATVAMLSFGGMYVAITRFITDVQNIPLFLADVRARRARGRAVYLSDVVPASFFELVAFSGIGAIYFLFAPFPWHVEAIQDLAGLAESITGIAFFLFAFAGIPVIWRKSPLAVLTLLTGLVVYSVLYGFGTANYGTALRHRQTVFWIILVLGAIGISNKVRFEI